MKDLLGWFVLFFAQTACQREKKILVVSWVIIRDEKGQDIQQGAQLSAFQWLCHWPRHLKSGNVFNAAASRLHNLAVMRGFEREGLSTQTH